jgi:hypothetical protein
MPTRLPAVLAFSLLAFQAAIPWTVPHFATQDGPSHVYTATVAKALLFHRNSTYAPVYQFNRRIVPNWGSTIAVGVISTVVGATHAEQALMSLALCAGFFAISYAMKALAPELSPWTPVTNVLLQIWFLWLGYYAFYLGMVLCPILIGYYIRHIHQLTPRRALLLAGGLVALFFTHLVPAALTTLTLIAIGIWTYLLGPFIFRSPSAARHPELMALALLPTLILFASFAASSAEPLHFKPSVAEAWNNFPGYVFATAAGRSGGQTLLWPALLCYIALAAAGMRRREWQTPRGGLAIAAVLTMLVYLFVPDSGLGGEDAKVRFAWGFFIVGGLLAGSVRAVRPLRIPIAIYTFAFLLPNLVSTAKTLSASSQAVEDYLAAVSAIPNGARFIRVQYPTPGLPERYGFAGIGRAPLFHLDAYIAARCGCVDLTDYQAPSKVFPVDFTPAIDDGLRYSLADLQLELPGNRAAEVLPWLRATLPVPIDYVILVADESASADPGFSQVLANLDSGMRLVGTSRSKQFVRLYQRTALR